jgi:hypothetical protein
MGDRVLLVEPFHVDVPGKVITLIDPYHYRGRPGVSTIWFVEVDPFPTHLSQRVVEGQGRRCRESLKRTDAFQQVTTPGGMLG